MLGFYCGRNLKRVIQSPLARVERAAIDWLLPRTPHWVTPDGLTALGVLGAMIVFAGYALSWVSPHFVWLASAGLVIHWLGDSLDGGLARYRRIEKPSYGFFLDQCVDVLGNLLICTGLGLSPFTHLGTALLALAGYHMLTIYTLVRACLDGVFHVTLLNSGPTELRLALILMNALIAMFGAPQFVILGLALTWCDVTVSLFAFGFATTFLYLVTNHARRLRAKDSAGS